MDKEQFEKLDKELIEKSKTQDWDSLTVALCSVDKNPYTLEAAAKVARRFSECNVERFKKGFDLKMKITSGTIDKLTREEFTEEVKELLFIASDSIVAGGNALALLADIIEGKITPEMIKERLEFHKYAIEN